MYTVYKVFDDETRYVGVTQDFKLRWAKHISASRHPKTKKDSWLQSRIQNNSSVFMLSIESTNDRTQAYEKERYWIRHYRAIDAPLFNVLPKRKK